MGKLPRWALSLVTVFAPAAALAQAPGPPAAAPSQPAPPAQTAAPAGSGAAAAGSAPAEPTVPATGYGWSSGKKKVSAGRPVRSFRGGGGAAAVLPGFDTYADGSSRLFVELTQQVAVAEKHAPGTVTYVFKGTHVNLSNNLHSLVTVHFNTPVTRARLVPKGGDLWFVVDLRANVQPTWKVESAKDGGAVFHVDFPAGNYLPAGGAESAPEPEAPPMNSQ
jgi:hypothetical protein